MKRIIAFDGLDCTGKTTVINKLYSKLKNDWNVFIFHLTSPAIDTNSLFNSKNGFALTNDDLSIIQWEKNLQTMRMIADILQYDTTSLILLDRTPFSEEIWQEFFNRGGDNTPTNLLTNFLPLFKDLNNNMLYINLDVESTLLVSRISKRDEDRKNFLNAFDNMTKPCVITGDNLVSSKIAFMVEKLKTEFNMLNIILRNAGGIEVQTCKNNNPEDYLEIEKIVLNNLV